MRLKPLPLRIALRLHVESERNELKRILLCRQVKSLQIVIKSLLIGDVPVELEMVVQFELIGTVRTNTPNWQLCLKGAFAKLFRLGIACQFQKTTFSKLFYSLKFVLFLLFRSFQPKLLLSLLFDFLSFSEALEHLNELVVSALLPV